MLKYKDDFVEVWNNDSRDLSFIKDKSVHLVITSPPYNVRMNYSAYNDALELDEYYNLLREVFSECYRVLVPGGRIAVNCPSCCRQTTVSKNAFVAVNIHNILKEIGFLPREWVGWVKVPPIENETEYKDIHRHQRWGKSTSWGSWCSPSDSYLRDVMEYIIVMYKEQSNLEGDKNKIDITRDEFLMYSNNCWFILPTTENKSGHPAAFPEELAYRLMKFYTYQENVILDPFAGSGTVGVVAKRFKRKAILVEIDSGYCDLIKQKVSQEYLF